MAAFDPNESVIVKIADKDFSFRAGTVREWRDYERLMTPLLNRLETEPLVTLLASKLADASQAAALTDVLDSMRIDEFYRLANNFQGRVALTLLEKKASE